MTALDKEVSAVFKRSIGYITELDRVLRLCLQGLSQISKLPALAEAIANVEKEDDNEPFSAEQQQHLDETAEMAAFAAREIESGFPTLHAHTVIALWGALEILVEDIVVFWLQKTPGLLSSNSIAKIKIPLGEYELLDTQERMRFVSKELARSLNTDLKIGVGRFEAVLTAVDLGGTIEEDLRQSLLELSQIRNVLVHRAHIIDRPLKEMCPWLALEVGQKLRIDHDMYLKYFGATHDYLLCLINRVRVHQGLDEYDPDRTAEPCENAD